MNTTTTIMIATYKKTKSWCYSLKHSNQSQVLLFLQKWGKQTKSYVSIGFYLSLMILLESVKWRGPALKIFHLSIHEKTKSLTTKSKKNERKKKWFLYWVIASILISVGLFVIFLLFYVLCFNLGLNFIYSSLILWPE